MLSPLMDIRVFVRCPHQRACGFVGFRKLHQTWTCLLLTDARQCNTSDPLSFVCGLLYSPILSIFCNQWWKSTAYDRIEIIQLKLADKSTWWKLQFPYAQRVRNPSPNIISWTLRWFLLFCSSPMFFTAATACFKLKVVHNNLIFL